MMPARWSVFGGGVPLQGLIPEVRRCTRRIRVVQARAPAPPPEKKTQKRIAPENPSKKMALQALPSLKIV